MLPKKKFHEPDAWLRCHTDMDDGVKPARARFVNAILRLLDTIEKQEIATTFVSAAVLHRCADLLHRIVDLMEKTGGGNGMT